MNRLKTPVWYFAGGLILLQIMLVAIIVHGESLYVFVVGGPVFALRGAGQCRICGFLRRNSPGSRKGTA
jgi:hypothetical protein